MSVPLSERGRPRVNAPACIGCGQCVAICPDHVLSLRDGKAIAGDGIFLGCIACGHCMTVCPTRAVAVEGRGLTPADLIPLTEVPRATHAAFHSLLLTRRSVRRFTDTEVPRDVVDRVLASTATAPMGIPPSDVGVLVFHGRAKVREFAETASAAFTRASRFLNRPTVTLMRPFVSRATFETLRDFVVPLLRLIPERRRQGHDDFTYDAPLAFLFHSGAGADPADAAIAATYAMLAAESLGLGSCLLGTTTVLGYHPAFRAKYGLEKDRVIGLGLIAGYPKPRWKATIRRRLERVQFA